MTLTSIEHAPSPSLRSWNGRTCNHEIYWYKTTFKDGGRKCLTASSIWRYGFTWHPPSHFFHWYSFASLGIDPAFMTTFGPPKPRNGVVSCIPGTPRLSRNIVRTQHRKRKFRFLTVLYFFFRVTFSLIWGVWGPFAGWGHHLVLIPP